MANAAEALTIEARNLRFGIEAAPDPDWFEKDPKRSAYCDALSIFFPEGERFFITSVQHYLPKIKDPTLQAQAKQFCIQEAMHTREHRAYNEGLRKLGYPVDLMEERVKVALAKVTNPLKRLALTAAIEHLTATLAHLVLNDPRILANTPKAYHDLWTWHCLEEMEHKAVAYDVLMQVTKDMPAYKRYLLRCIPLAIVTKNLHRILLTNLKDILRSRGIATGWKHSAHAFWVLFCFPGYYRRALGYYLRYYRPGFHPWKGDDGSAAEPWRAYFSGYSENSA